MNGVRSGEDGKRYGDRMTITPEERELFRLRDDMLMFDVKKLLVSATHYFIKKYVTEHLEESGYAHLYNLTMRVDFIENGVIAQKTLQRKGIRSNATVVEVDGVDIVERINYAADLIYTDHRSGIMSELGPCNIAIHEVAHYLDRIMHEIEGVDYHCGGDGHGSHGVSWAKIVRMLGGSDETTLLVAKRDQVSELFYLYRCVTGCPIERHVLRRREHAEIINGSKVKRCKSCQSRLKYMGTELVERDGAYVPHKPVEEPGILPKEIILDM
jgi:predicted SprT family Zn-dependent metalloprotease